MPRLQCRDLLGQNPAREEHASRLQSGDRYRPDALKPRAGRAALGHLSKGFRVPSDAHVSGPRKVLMSFAMREAVLALIDQAGHLVTQAKHRRALETLARRVEIAHGRGKPVRRKRLKPPKPPAQP